MARQSKMVWNTPNILTIMRLLLIPVFCVLMIKDKMTASLVVFLVAGATDLLDGYLARKQNEITAFGKLMDPLADKLMVLCLMIGLTVKNIIPLPAFIILIVKEAIMGAGTLFLLKRNKVVYSKPIGKIAQFTLFVALVLCFFHADFNRMGFPLHLYLLWLGVALAIVSLFYYMDLNLKDALFPPKPALQHRD